VKTQFGKHTVEFEPHGAGFGAEHATHEFPNGYKASIVRGGARVFHTSGGTHEMAVLYRDQGLVYDTPITDDVLPELSAEEVAATLDAIEALPPRELVAS
jgi:hypothetical protein